MGGGAQSPPSKLHAGMLHSKSHLLLPLLLSQWLAGRLGAQPDGGGVVLTGGLVVVGGGGL